MSEKNDLKSYLLHWKEHFTSDVAGQTAESAHLTNEVLQDLFHLPITSEKGLAGQVDHLASCPGCMERWAQFCRVQNETSTPKESDASSISYGSTEEDDVVGQSTDLKMWSHCKRFMLSFTAPPTSPRRGTLTLKTSDQNLDGIRVQVRAKTGQLLLDGLFQQGKLSSEISDPQNLDWTVWTVIVGASDTDKE